MPLHKQAVGDEAGERLHAARGLRSRLAGAHVVRKLHNAQSRRQNVADLCAHRSCAVDEVVRCRRIDRAIDHRTQYPAAILSASLRPHGIDRAGRGGKMAARVRRALRRLDAMIREAAAVLIVELDRDKQSAVAAQSARQAQCTRRVGRRVAQTRPSSTWSGGRWPSAQKRMLAMTLAPESSRPSIVALPMWGWAMTLGSAIRRGSTMGSPG